MSSRLARIGVLALVATAALTAVGVASAASAKPSMWLHVLPSPRTPLVDATVTVTDAAGATVGTGRTNRAGTVRIAIRTKGAKRPFLVRTSGGTVDRAPFTGHAALSTRFADGRLQNVNVVSTAAAAYVAEHGGSIATVERRLFKGLGLSTRFGHLHLRHSSRVVDRRKLNRHHAAQGGFDGTVDLLVSALEGDATFPDWSVKRAEGPRRVDAPRTRGTSGSSIPCGVQTVQAPSGTVNTYVAAASVQMIAGLVSGFMTKDPSLFLNGAIGMAMAETPGMTTASMMASIEAQLACISTQINDLQNSTNRQMLATSVDTIATCENNVNSTWAEYNTVTWEMSTVGTDGKTDGSMPDPDYGYTSTNSGLAKLMNDINTNIANCGGLVNQALFNGYGGQIPAWQQLVANYKSGTYRSSDKVAFGQQSVAEMQQFLQYWGTIQYQYTALLNEWYNYQATFNGKNMFYLQQGALVPTPANPGPACPAATASAANVQPQATNACQWQQNIVNVWPADLYTDEVLYWFSSTTSGSAIGADALSAVPVAWGTATNAWTNAPNLITPKYLADKEIDKYDKRWNNPNAVASFNNQPATDIGGLNQSIFFRRAPAVTTSSPSNSKYSNMDTFGSFFSSWLNAAKPDPVNGSYASVDLSPGSTSPKWQILGNDGEVLFDDGGVKCGKNYSSDGGWFYAHYTAHNAFYSPSPWTKNTGGTIGGGTSQDPCSVTVPIAFLKSRAWTQGTKWPTAPVITSSGTVAANATLTAQNCPPGSCNWAISDPNAPKGLALSPTGTLSWPGAAPGTTATVQIVAGNTMIYSQPVTLTITA